MSHYRSQLGTEIPTFQSLIESEQRPSAFRRIVATLRLWRGRRAARQALTQIDARSLRDIGIAPEMIEYEIAQPFWRDLRDWRA